MPLLSPPPRPPDPPPLVVVIAIVAAAVGVVATALAARWRLRRRNKDGHKVKAAKKDEAELSEACAFWFVKAKCLRESKEDRLLTLQEIRRDHPDWLEQLTVTFRDCCTGQLRKKVLSVSHRWEHKKDPDPEGIQYAELRKFLMERPEIELVWIDYSCMPQGERTDKEKSEFKTMLPNINLIYLSAHVLIIMDSTYFARFWTLFEAWLSMQSITSEGLRPSSEEGRRSTIVCIHSGSKHDIAKLKDTLMSKTPQEAYDLLKEEDIQVTNASDKKGQLPKLLKLDKFAVDQFAAGARRTELEL